MTRPICRLSPYTREKRARAWEEEKAFLEVELAKHDGKVAALACALGVDRSNMYRKLKELGIRRRRRKPKPEQPDAEVSGVMVVPPTTCDGGDPIV